MINFDFEYYKPDTIEEAVQCFAALTKEKKQPLYISGGTEVISMARKGVLKFGALIDLKNIKEMNEYNEGEDNLYYGANMTLNKAAEKGSFPLLGSAAKTIADHTIRNRITLGGNICGRLAFREAVLPFLLVDAQVVIAGAYGLKELPIMEAFDKRMVLSPGEFLAGLKVDSKAVKMESINIRKEKTVEIDYPVLHIASVKAKEGIRLAISGLCPFPFRAKEAENYINNIKHSNSDMKGIYQYLPSAVKDDHIGSAEYRKALFEQALQKIMKKWGEA